MTSVVGMTPRSQALAGEQLQNLIKRPWDPVLGAYSQNKLVRQFVLNTDKILYECQTVIRCLIQIQAVIVLL